MSIVGTLLGSVGSGGGSGCGFPPFAPVTFPSSNIQPPTGPNVRAAVAWYRFEVPAGPAVNVEINTLGSSIDTMLGLYDSSGNLIAYDDDSGPGTLSLIQETLNPGTYYVGVGEFYIQYDNTNWCATQDDGISDFNGINMNLTTF